MYYIEVKRGRMTVSSAAREHKEVASEVVCRCGGQGLEVEQ